MSLGRGQASPSRLVPAPLEPLGGAERGLREGSDPAAPEGPRDPLSEKGREGARGGAEAGGKGFFPPLPIGSRTLLGERQRASQTDVRARVQSDPGGRVHTSRLRAQGAQSLEPRCQCGEGDGTPTPAFWPGEISWTEEPGEPRSVGSQRV